MHNRKGQNHSMKIGMAAQLADIGKFPLTWKAIINAIYNEIIGKIDSTQLAQLADRMRAQFNLGYDEGYEDAH